MKNLLTLLLILFGLNAFGQSDQNLAKGLGLFVFPAKDQDEATQNNDEYACYKWAMKETGINPLDPPKVEAEKVETGPDGSAVVGAAGGAAAGAAIGAIAGDTGKGAAIGAVVGGLRGRRARKYGEYKEAEQNQAAAKATEEEMMNNFKKAFTACMTAKGYTVQ
ncbi:MAG: glycine zipper domain-containing protein [Reichenbachiella sp.]|uniref:glycine zipper domain-containing protein n=1 Tax=Reichenbachiella sp. TaxID=2184521 RepID=UPI003296EFBA